MSEDFKTTEMKRVLVFGGKTGWIGQMMVELVKEGTYGRPISSTRVEGPVRTLNVSMSDVMADSSSNDCLHFSWH